MGQRPRPARAQPALIRTALKLLAAALLVLVVYWGVSNAFVHGERVAGTRVTIKTQLGDDGRALPLARRAAHDVDGWLRGEFGHPLSQATTIRLSRTGECQWIENLVGEQSTAWSGDGGVCVYTGRPAWKSQLGDRGAGGFGAEEILVHELIHEAQRELGCVDEPDHQRFRWLLEGMAVYGAREAMVLGGRRRARDTDAYIRGFGGYRSDLEPLEVFETRTGDDAAYQLWHRAVRRLADRHGGAAALREFCAAAGRGTEWHRAFAGAFGLSTGAFYREFERAR